MDKETPAIGHCDRGSQGQRQDQDLAEVGVRILTEEISLHDALVRRPAAMRALID